MRDYIYDDESYFADNEHSDYIINILDENTSDFIIDIKDYNVKKRIKSVTRTLRKFKFMCLFD